MVVRDDHRRGIRRQGRLHHFAWMYLGAVDRSAEQLDELQHAMARVQQDRDEDLVLQRRHPQSQELLGYRRIRQRDPALQALVDEPSRRSEEHTSELQSLMRISYAVFCL